MRTSLKREGFCFVNGLNDDKKIYISMNIDSKEDAKKITKLFEKSGFKAKIIEVIESTTNILVTYSLFLNGMESAVALRDIFEICNDYYPRFVNYGTSEM